MSARKGKTVTLDVRPKIAKGEEPFALIMLTVARLRADEKLLLIAPFEPMPLYEVMSMRGFEHQSRPIDNGDWEALFFRSAPVPHA